MRIFQKEVDRFVFITEERKRVNDEYDTLKAALLEKMDAGASCPKQGPHLLDLREHERTNPQWKDACFSLLKRFLKNTPAAKAEMEGISEGFPKTRVRILEPVPNSDYFAAEVTR